MSKVESSPSASGCSGGSARDTQHNPLSQQELDAERTTNKYPSWLHRVPYPTAACPRFWATTKVLLLVAVVNQSLLPWLHACLPFALYCPIALLLMSASLQWLCVFPNSQLHLQRRAHFDESNIVATYHSSSKYNPDYVFTADPPTPGPTDEMRRKALSFVDDDELNHEGPAADFKAKRDDHYRNEFEFALRMNRDLQLQDHMQKTQERRAQADKSTTTPQTSVSNASTAASSESATAVPPSASTSTAVQSSSSATSTASSKRSAKPARH